MFFILVGSVKSSGKIAYITGIFPYFCLTSLLINTCFQPGALQGIMRYLSIDFSEIFTTEIWTDAAMQVFYSQGFAYGTLLSYATHNPFRFNCFNAAWRLSVINGLTSFYACFLIYATLGTRAFQEYGFKTNTTEFNCDTEQFNGLVAQGTQLVFVLYPIALSKIGTLSWLWALLFFGMIVLLAIGTLSGMLQVVIECARDVLQTKEKNVKWLTGMIILAVSVIAFPFYTKAGFAWMEVFNSYATLIVLQIIAGLEMLAVSYLYGMNRFIRDVQDMLGFKVPLEKFWKVMFSIASPMFIFITVIVSIFNAFENNFQDGLGIPYSGFGWLMPLSSIIVITTMAIKNWGKFKVEKQFYARRDWVLQEEDLQNRIVITG